MQHKTAKSVKLLQIYIAYSDYVRLKDIEVDGPTIH